MPSLYLAQLVVDVGRKVVKATGGGLLYCAIKCFKVHYFPP